MVGGVEGEAGYAEAMHNVDVGEVRRVDLGDLVDLVTVAAHVATGFRAVGSGAVMGAQRAATPPAGPFPRQTSMTALSDCCASSRTVFGNWSDSSHESILAIRQQTQCADLATASIATWASVHLGEGKAVHPDEALVVVVAASTSATIASMDAHVSSDVTKGPFATAVDDRKLAGETVLARALTSAVDARDLRTVTATILEFRSRPGGTRRRPAIPLNILGH